MAKSSRDKDRRAVVEQMRREQQRAERRRTSAIIAVCAVVGLVIIGLGAYPVIKNAQQQSALESKDLTALGVPLDQASCTDVQDEEAVGSADHRPETEQLSYPAAPPAFGPHYPVWASLSRKFYTAQDRPPLGELVHNLEHGYSILWYDESIAADDEQLGVVKGIANKFAGTELEDKFIAVPWTGEDGAAFPDGAHVALTHWSMGGTNGNPEGQLGVWQFCDQVSGEAVGEFMKDYPYSDSPEPGAA